MSHVVDDFRPGAARVLARTGALAVVPFAIGDVVSGEWRIGVALLALAALLVFVSWLVGAGHYSPLVAIALFVVPTTTVIAWGVVTIDVYLSYWAFVAVTATYLVLPQRWAWVASGSVIGVVAPVTGHRYGAWIGVRLAVCLLLIGVFGGVAIRLVDRLQLRLVDRVITDPMTGALNRTTLADELRRVIDASPAASLLAIDVDEFKSINDRFGHATGDRVLVDVVTVLRSSLAAGTPLFRLGGEEFLAVVEGDVAGASAVAAGVVAGIAGHHFLDRHAVTVSVGVAELGGADSVDGWMQRADTALYAAKAAGRNTLVVA